MSKVIQTVEELDAVLHWRGKHAVAIRERDALQALLTAADEKNDKLSTAYVSAGEREHKLRLRVNALEGLLQMFIENTDDKDVIELAQHALKPAEGGGSTCNQIREETGLPINRPCKACNGGACIDR